MSKRRTLDDILGGDDSPQEEDSVFETDSIQLSKGVSQNWLSIATGLDRRTVKKRMAQCVSVGTGSHGEKLYGLLDAMSYLVKPKFDIKKYLRTMNAQELPPTVRKEFWAAENARMDWMVKAGDLWHTADVLKVLMGAFKTIRDTVQGWADEIEREAGMTPQQYTALLRLVDSLRTDLHEKLIELPKLKQTEPFLAEDPSGDLDEDSEA